MFTKILILNFGASRAQNLDFIRKRTNSATHTICLLIHGATKTLYVGVSVNGRGQKLR